MPLEVLVMAEFSQDKRGLNQSFHAFSRLPGQTGELAALDALHFKEDAGTGEPLFSVDKEVSANFFAGEIEIFVKIDREVDIRLAIAHLI